MDHIINTPIGSLLFKVNAKNIQSNVVTITTKDIKPDIPQGMSVQECKTVLLQCSPNHEIENLTFTCSWQNLETEGFGCNGECLDAWEWESNNYLVVIGTEDEECLNQRLGLAHSSVPEKYPVDMNNNEITINLEQLQTTKGISLHFVIAWNELPEKVENSCWYAVDISHKLIQKL